MLLKSARAQILAHLTALLASANLQRSAFQVAAGKMTTYEPKNILVTGGAGFIASHVVLRLVKNYPSYKVSSLKPNFFLLFADLAAGIIIMSLLKLGSKANILLAADASILKM